MIIPVVLSGGVGSRLWPLSRSCFPKQFLNLFSEHTMLQNSILRLNGIEIDNPIIVANETHKFVIKEQLSNINIFNPSIILEPCQRNTAPAITAAVIKSLEVDEDPIIIVLPSDQIVKDEKIFIDCVKHAIDELENIDNENIITFGITPFYPATGYGYIKRSSNINLVEKIERFVEKPSKEIAEEYLRDGNYLWNGGIYIFRAKSFLSEIKKYNYEVFDFSKKSIEQASAEDVYLKLDFQTFSMNPNISIDYAVMEKTSKGKVIELNAGWNDVGSWNFLWEATDKDDQGNVIEGNVYSCNVKNSLIYGDRRTIAAIGVENLVIADTPDAILICNKDNSQDVNAVVSYFKSNNNPIATENIINYKPWGYRERLNDAPNYKINKLVIKPGHKQSFHYHKFHSENWVILSGKATGIIDGEHVTLTEKQSIYIPEKVTHLLSNETDEILEILEIQAGNEFDEQDNYRIFDEYGR